MRLRPGRVLAGVAQLGLAATLTGSHFITTSPYVYPHYVLLIVGHPPLLRRVFGIRLRPWQITYISVALFLHPMGGLYRLYSTVWYFDHVTHTLSATLVAAIGYVLIAAYNRRTGSLPGVFVPVYTLAFVMTAGVLWELIETWTPILTVYGHNDTALDYVFDAVGGLLVAIFGPMVLGRAARGLAETTLPIDEVAPAMDGEEGHQRA